jgi:cytochrome b pre-mRNA-processing protein 3
MSLLARLMGRSHDERDGVRPLWHRVVEIAREKEWYATCGVADSVAGRFDMITLILALVLLRMEREEALITPSVWLTELFVEDMDGQLRQGGVGDLVVGKHIGKLMGTLGGRLGAYRTALASGRTGRTVELARAIARNMTFRQEPAQQDTPTDGPSPLALALARRARAFAAGLALVPGDRVLAAEIGR